MDMSGDNFTQKEILLQVMKEMREIRTDIADQRVLLQTHINASEERDVKIVELRREVKEIKVELDDLRSQFVFFKLKVTLVAGAIATIASLAGQKLFAFLFNTI